ncbi:hypothetical protein EK904_012638 [Melospiza melodia maxima]|nr:hypothetical protein EK904_012638 [Melospiza melodia maxima]
MEFYKESKQPAMANLVDLNTGAMNSMFTRSRDINLSVWICVVLALSGPQRNPAKRMSFSHNFTLFTEFTLRKVSYEEFLELYGWALATDVV